MKILKPLFLIALLTSILTVSCTKENTYVPKGRMMKVEYVISCESESVFVHYLYPQNGKMNMIHSEQNKSYHTISFETTSGQSFSIEAENKTHGRKEITVQIIIDGNIVKETTSYDPSVKAIAYGNF